MNLALSDILTSWRRSDMRSILCRGIFLCFCKLVCLSIPTTTRGYFCSFLFFSKVCRSQTARLGFRDGCQRRSHISIVWLSFTENDAYQGKRKKSFRMEMDIFMAINNYLYDVLSMFYSGMSISFLNDLLSTTTWCGGMKTTHLFIWNLTGYALLSHLPNNATPTGRPSHWNVSMIKPIEKRFVLHRKDTYGKNILMPAVRLCG